MLPLRDSVPGRTTPYVTVGLIVVGLWLGLTRYAGLEPLSFMTAFLLTVLVGPFASLRSERGTRPGA